MDLQKLRETLQSEGVIFSFSGTISQQILTSIAETMEKKMESHGISNKTTQNLFGIFVEQMQNVISYSKERNIIEKNVFESPGIAVIGFDKNKEKYYVGSGNIMDINDKEKLLTKLDKINSLDEKGLKEYYRELRKSGKDKHNRGAGLGFLEMKKKSSEPLDYMIKPIGDTNAFFSIKTYI